MDLPLRPGEATGPKELDERSAGARAPGAREATPSGPRYVGSARTSRRGLWVFLGLLIAAVLLWLFLPGPPRARLSVAEIDFGTLRVGNVSEEFVVSLGNQGERSLRVTGFEAVGEA